MAKSPEGKSRSSQNATTHGLRMTKMRLLADESAEEYEAARKGWYESYAPEGFLEERLVEQVIFNDWLLRRAMRRLLDAEAAKMDEDYERRLELMLRYKGTAERAFYRALGALEALRKDRRQAWITQRRLIREAWRDNLWLREQLAAHGLPVPPPPMEERDLTRAGKERKGSPPREP